MTSPWTDLDRPPLPAHRLQAALDRRGGTWRAVEVLAETGSTNVDLAARARAGAPEGLVLVAERQVGGRGRLGRVWQAPARAGLTFSVLVRPVTVPETRWPLLSLVAGVALAEALRDACGLPVRLKWPNDVLGPSGGKLAGLLAERVDAAVVLGIGLNVTTRRFELADLPMATSLLLEGSAGTDRPTVLLAVLAALDGAYRRFRDCAAGDGPGTVRDGDLLDRYRRLCATLGRDVRVHLPGGTTVTGRAREVDHDGRLVVAEASGRVRAWTAGDVEHLREGD